jgi:hypothetical protein
MAMAWLSSAQALPDASTKPARLANSAPVIERASDVTIVRTPLSVVMPEHVCDSRYWPYFTRHKRAVQEHFHPDANEFLGPDTGFAIATIVLSAEEVAMLLPQLGNTHRSHKWIV